MVHLVWYNLGHIGRQISIKCAEAVWITMPLVIMHSISLAFFILVEYWETTFLEEMYSAIDYVNKPFVYKTGLVNSYAPVKFQSSVQITVKIVESQF